MIDIRIGAGDGCGGNFFLNFCGLIFFVCGGKKRRGEREGFTPVAVRGSCLFACVLLYNLAGIRVTCFLVDYGAGMPRQRWYEFKSAP